MSAKSVAVAQGGHDMQRFAHSQALLSPPRQQALKQHCRLQTGITSEALGGLLPIMAAPIKKEHLMMTRTSMTCKQTMSERG